jgi:hypothetical protein
VRVGPSLSLAVALGSVVVSSPAAGTAPLPASIVTSAPITGLAQDGGRVAWAEDYPSRTVHVRVVATGAETVVHGTDVGTLALGGSRALWVFSQPAINYYDDVYTAVRARPTHVQGFEQDDVSLKGGYVAAIAGDGSTLAYATIEIGADHCGSDSCHNVLESGSVTGVDPGSGKPAVLPGIPASVALAVAGRTIAVVPALPGEAPNGSAVGDRAVELYDAAHSTRLTRIDVDAQVADLALSSTTVAVLLRDARGDRIALFDSPTGQPETTWPVRPGTADLSISGSHVVYRTGHAIRLLGRARPLATAAGTLVALSVEGDRVAWAENLKHGGRIAFLRLDS